MDIFEQLIQNIFIRSSTQKDAESDNYTSHVVVKSSTVQQSGNYHCAANPGQSQHITVHVHHGKLDSKNGKRLESRKTDLRVFFQNSVNIRNMNLDSKIGFRLEKWRKTQFIGLTH